MAIVYEEFDVTAGGLAAALQTKITSHPAWSVLAPAGIPSTTNTVAITSGGTSFQAASSAGFFIGQRIKWVVSGTTYYRLVTDVIGSTISFNISTGVSTPIGTTISAETNLVKATTTRGADMIVDLQSGVDSTETIRMNLRFWRSLPANYGSAVVTESMDRFIYWRNSGGSLAHTLHVTLSVGKEHLFIAIEGPRANEAGAVSTSYGSLKNYAFISDLIPYHASDTNPVIVVGAASVSSGAASTMTTGAHEADISRNYANTTSWGSGRLGTIAFPSHRTTDSANLQRDCAIDGKTYLFPYVLFSNASGIRGRLTRFFNAGLTHPAPASDIGDPVGTKVTFEGVTYKLLAVNKSDGNIITYGPFGSIGNSNTTGTYWSIVVAVPFSE